MSKFWNTGIKKVSSFTCCSVISEIVIFHGKNGITQDRFDELWICDDYPPSIYTAMKLLNRKKIKWYIHNFMSVDDGIWNASFLRGLTSNGNIKWNANWFPSFHWTSNPDIEKMLNGSPFYGILKSHGKHYQWNQAPALYLKPDYKSIPFMAGVLATGQIVCENNQVYANYGKKSIEKIISFGIPIEKSTLKGKQNLISPFWPALFSKYMPNEGDKWMNIHHGGCNSYLYSSILSRMYVSNQLEKGAIPYLRSRRWTYDHFGKIENTESMWLKLGLSQIDDRVRKVIEAWTKSV